MTVSANISEEENLGRIVVSGKQAKYARKNNRNQINVFFLEREGQKLISVDRLDVAPSVDVLVANGEKVAAARTLSGGIQRTFYCWAVIEIDNRVDNDC